MIGNGASIGVVILILTVLLILFSHGKTQPTEGFTTAYDNNIPVTSHKQFSKERGLEMNPAMFLINQMTPIVPPSDKFTTSSIQALNTANASSKGLPGEFQLSSPNNPFQFNPEDMKLAEKAKFCQQYTASASCTGWDPPVRYMYEDDLSWQQRYNDWVRFTEECGLSLDTNGTNFKGDKHVGGLYIGKDNKLAQRDAAAGKSNKEKYYRPTLGTAKKGLFSIDKQSCNIIEEKMKCSTQKTFAINNCSQCYIQDKWLRMDDDSLRLVPEFYIGGKGTLEVTVRSGKVDKYELTSDVKKLTNLPNFSEGASIMFHVTGGGGNPMIYGFLASQTRKVNPFRYELMPLIETDQVSGMRPAVKGFLLQNDVKMNRIIPAVGKTGMKLIVKIPFTFLDVEDDACEDCDNSPFITQKSSADFLNSNPCFGPNAKPGKYSVNCLKEQFLAAGGTQEGTGLPKNEETANKLNFDDKGRPRDLPAIGEYLYERSVEASTGRSLSGTKLSIDEWNASSMFMLGKPVKSPCDGQENVPAKDITPECLRFVYRNQGEGGDFGATYTANFTLSSLIGKSADEKGNMYCQPNAPLDPDTNTGKKAIENLANLEKVKKLYSEKHAKANDNSKNLFLRSTEIKECYNVNLAMPPTEEVYWVGPGYNYTFEQAEEIAKELQGKVATYQQLYAAYKLGANWCRTGWIAEGGSYYPINEETIVGCASSPGIQHYQPGGAGVTVYGVKPSKDSDDAIKYKIQPFNTQTGQWNSMEVFQVFENTYDKTKEEAAQVCADVGATVATYAELEKTHQAGGQWCSASWVSDANKGNGYFPMQQQHLYCGGPGKIMELGAEVAPKRGDKPMFAVNCYGIKPNKNAPVKENRKLWNFFADVINMSNTGYSAYDYYKMYQPITYNNVGLVHPYYFPAVKNMPVKVSVISANVPDGMWYSTEKRLGLFQMNSSAADKFVFIFTPGYGVGFGGYGSEYEKCSASGITKKYAGNEDTKEKCESRGKCFNNKNGWPPCYEPNIGKNIVYIQDNNGLRVACEPDGTVNINRTWDGPWEAWYLEPVPSNPAFVAIRSYFGKYMSHDGKLKWLNATANNVGQNEMFILKAID